MVIPKQHHNSRQVNILIGGLVSRDATGRAKLVESAETVANTAVELECFRALREREAITAPERIEKVGAERVGDARSYTPAPTPTYTHTTVWCFICCFEYVRVGYLRGIVHVDLQNVPPDAFVPSLCARWRYRWHDFLPPLYERMSRIISTHIHTITATYLDYPRCPDTRPWTAPTGIGTGPRAAHAGGRAAGALQGAHAAAARAECGGGSRACGKLGPPACVVRARAGGMCLACASRRRCTDTVCGMLPALGSMHGRASGHTLRPMVSVWGKRCAECSLFGLVHRALSLAGRQAG